MSKRANDVIKELEGFMRRMGEGDPTFPEPPSDILIRIPEENIPTLEDIFDPQPIRFPEL